MVKNNINTSTNNNDDINTNSNNNKASFLIIQTHKTIINNNNRKTLTNQLTEHTDQTKDNINKSIDESRNQIPHYNNIMNSYQEQTLQPVKEITENYIESQKTMI